MDRLHSGWFDESYYISSLEPHNKVMCRLPAEGVKAKSYDTPPNKRMTQLINLNYELRIHSGSTRILAQLTLILTAVQIRIHNSLEYKYDYHAREHVYFSQFLYFLTRRFL